MGLESARKGRCGNMHNKSPGVTRWRLADIGDEVSGKGT